MWTWLPLWSISPKLQTAMVAWEDPRSLQDLRRAMQAPCRVANAADGGTMAGNAGAGNARALPF